jgi:hypothetical protein
VCSTRAWDSCLDQTRVGGRAGIHADRIKAELGQTIDQCAIATAEVKDPRTPRQHRRDNRVQVVPPPVVGHP